jgi:hypothetical protein
VSGRAGTAVVALLALLACGSEAAGADDPQSQARQVVAGAAVSYRAAFSIACRPDIWTKVLDNPELLGRLWVARGYVPAYQVSVRGDAIHVDDPTGLAGDIFVIVKRPEERQYWGSGKITHAAVPFFNTGQMVVVLRARPEGPRMVGNVEVFVRGDSLVARGALWAGRSVFLGFVERRVNGNLAEVTELIESLIVKPENGLTLLKGRDAEQFRALFVPPKPPPPPPKPRRKP